VAHGDRRGRDERLPGEAAEEQRIKVGLVRNLGHEQGAEVGAVQSPAPCFWFGSGRNLSRHWLDYFELRKRPQLCFKPGARLLRHNTSEEHRHCGPDALDIAAIAHRNQMVSCPYR
jgi:hypothetical protein